MAVEEGLETGSDDETLDCAFLTTGNLLLTSEAGAGATVRSVFLGSVIAGVSPVFVLTRGPKLILDAKVFFAGRDQAGSDVLLKVLWGFFVAVLAVPLNALPDVSFLEFCGAFR